MRKIYSADLFTIFVGTLRVQLQLKYFRGAVPNTAWEGSMISHTFCEPTFFLQSCYNLRLLCTQVPVAVQFF